MLSVKLSPMDFDYLQGLCDSLNMKKAEFVRLFIHSCKIGEELASGKTTVTLGGVGFEFDEKAMLVYHKKITDLLQGVSESVKIIPPKGVEPAMKRLTSGLQAV